MHSYIARKLSIHCCFFFPAISSLSVVALFLLKIISSSMTPESTASSVLVSATRACLRECVRVFVRGRSCANACLRGGEEGIYVFSSCDTGTHACANDYVCPR